MNDTISRLTEQLCSILKSSTTDLPRARVTKDRPGMSVLDLFWPRINVYLLDVNENPSLRNQSTPSGNEQSGRLGLDLRYLVTFYGSGTSPQVLMQAGAKGLASKSIFNPAGGTASSNVHMNLVSTDSAEMYHIWEMIGVRHAPSLIYRITGLVI